MVANCEMWQGDPSGDIQDFSVDFLRHRQGEMQAPMAHICSPRSATLLFSIGRGFLVSGFSGLYVVISQSTLFPLAGASLPKGWARSQCGK